MTIQEARTILHESHAFLPSTIEAAAVVSRSNDGTMDDLLVCLDHGGLAAEFASMALYRRMNRPIPADHLFISLDRAEWEAYLQDVAPLRSR